MNELGNPMSLVPMAIISIATIAVIVIIVIGMFRYADKHKDKG